MNILQGTRPKPIIIPSYERPVLLVYEGQPWEPKINEPIKIEETAEQILSFHGTLIGVLNGKRFGCSLDLSLCNNLFFNECAINENLANSPSMSVPRTREFLEQICAVLEKTGWINEWNQMQKIKVAFEFQQTLKKGNVVINANNVSVPQISPELQKAREAKARREAGAINLKAKKEKEKADKQAAKAKAAEEKEAKRQADAAAREEEARQKQLATEKAQEAARIAAQKAQEAQNAAQKQAEERAAQKKLTTLLKTIDQRPDIKPIYDANKKRFYGKQDGNVIEIVMNPNKPSFRVLTSSTVRAMNTQEVVNFMDFVDEHLNTNGTYNDILGEMGGLLGDFNKKPSLPAQADVPKVYQAVCEQLSPNVPQVQQKAKTPTLPGIQHTK